MSDWGLKISKAGYDTTTTDPNKLSFSSAHNQFKIKQEGTVSISWSSGESGTKQVVVNHNSGYSPAFVAFMKKPEDGWWYPFDDESVSTSPVHRIRSWSTTTQLVFEITRDGSPLNANITYIKYFILVEDG